MSERKTWLRQEAEAYLASLTFPFKEKGFWRKTPFFIVVAFIPLVNLLLLRGWRLELTRRMGWSQPEILPSSNLRAIFRYGIHGAKLWLITAIYVAVPFILISKLGLRGTGVLWGYIQEFMSYIGAYVSGEASQSVVSFLFFWLLGIVFKGFLVFLIENIWLVIYLPMYRIAMIRTALTGRFIASHLAVAANFRFLRRNLSTICLMYALFFLEAISVLIISTLLTMTVVLVPFIPFIILFASYWSSGYDYGLLARRMVWQEQLVPPVGTSLLYTTAKTNSYE